MKTTVHKRATHAAALFAVGALFLSACSGGADSETNADGSDSGTDAGDSDTGAGSEADGGSLTGELSVAVYGGPTEVTWNESFGTAFSEEYPDVDLTIAGVQNPASLLFTQEGDVQFDLILATASDVAQLAESGDTSKFTPIDPASLERSDHVIEQLLSVGEDGLWTGAPVAITYYGIVYNTDEHEASDIQSWADLADPMFDDSYLMNSPSFFATVELPMFALANGGSDTDLEPGFELLERTLPNVHGVTQDLANSAAQMESGAVTVAPFYFSQFSQLLDSELPVDMVLPDEGGFGSPLFLVISADSTNEEAALKFLDTVLSADSQIEVQGPSAYIPVVDDAELIDKIKERSGFDSVDDILTNLVFPDYGYIAEQRDENTQRIQDMLAQ